MDISSTTRERTLPTGLETVSACAVRTKTSRNNVLRAIKAGQLPAYTATTNRDHDIYLVKPADADALWGIRTAPLQHDPELIFA